MYRHEFYRIEVLTELGTSIGAAAASCDVCGVMVNKGLEGPDLPMGVCYQFWFTREGMQKIGRYCLRALLEQYGRALIIIKKAEYLLEEVAFQDKFQVAIVKGKLEVDDDTE